MRPLPPIRWDIIMAALIGAGLLAFAAVKLARADEDYTLRDLQQFCNQQPVNCRYYVNGMIGGLVYGGTSFTTDQTVFGCIPNQLRLDTVARALLSEMNSPRNTDLLDKPDQVGIWGLMVRTYPCGEPS